MTEGRDTRAGNAPAGWYHTTTTGRPRYWDGTTWAADQPPAFAGTMGDPQVPLLAAALRRQARWRLLAAVVAGSAVAIIILMSTTSTVIWWGGYLVAGSLAWGALKRFRLAGQLTGSGVGAAAWTAMAAGLGLVALLAAQAATYWSSPLEPISDTVVGSCWKDSGGTQVENVDCGSPGAQYTVTNTTTNPDSCSTWYLSLDDGTYACMRDL